MRRCVASFILSTLAACGGPSASDFIGSWNRSGSQTITCNGTPTTNSFAGVLTIAAGTTSNQIIGTQPDGCQTTYTISGSTASATAGQTCTIAVTGGSWLVTVQSHTLVFSGSGGTGSTLAATSSTTIAETVNGTTTNCTASATGTFTKQ